MPSWFELGDSCPGATRVEKSYFPPSATCVYGTSRSVDYIPWLETLILTVAIVLLAIMTVAGLVVLGSRPPRYDQAALGELKPRRPVLHMLGAAVLGVVTVMVARPAIIIAALLGGPPGGAAVFVIVVLGAIGSASALDRAVGPDRGGSSRRATVLVVTGSAAMLILVIATWRAYEEYNTLLGPGWAIAMGAGVFAVLAGVQWLGWP